MKGNNISPICHRCVNACYANKGAYCVGCGVYPREDMAFYIHVVFAAIRDTCPDFEPNQPNK